jgi:3-oxoacyl-[acyl-carrier-protein] synthase II
MNSDAAVVVTGVGMVTPLGDGAEHTWRSLLEGRTALRPWSDLETEGFRVSVAARVDLGAIDERWRGRVLALQAAREALADAGVQTGRGTPGRRTGIYIGTTMGESAQYERAAAGDPFELSAASGHGIAAHLARELGARGPVEAYGTACAAGNYAIGAALQDLRSGEVDVAVAGGVEPFSRIAMLGFSRARAMSATRCRPFDRDRSGMQLGEGAAMLIMERGQEAGRRGARSRARVAALGLSCDAGHPTAPSADGSGLSAAMRDALEQAGTDAADVGWICAHGSGTRVSDAAEARAIRDVFGSAPTVSGLKGSLGHSMGAATAMEAALSVLSLERGVIPPTVGLQHLDPELGLDVVGRPRSTEADWVVSCGFAFGGLNSALLLGAP